MRAAKSSFVAALDLFERPPPPRPLAPMPTPVPPAWAAEVAAPPPRARDFTSPTERVWHPDGRCFVERTRGFGTHIYHAWERADALFYSVLDDFTYGRIDTRRAPRGFNGVTDVTDLRAWEQACWREALDLIRQICIETAPVRDRHGRPETGPGHAVYDGPGRVTMLSNPVDRYSAALARRRPA